MLKVTNSTAFFGQNIAPLAQKEIQKGVNSVDKAGDNTKSVEDITQSVDTRNAKIQNIKSRIEEGSYEIDFTALAQKLAQKLLV